MFFKPLIERWTVEAMASDLCLPAKNIRRWIDSDSIPADWFAAVARAAEVRGYDEITVERLAGIAEERRLARTEGQAEAAA